MLDALDAVGWLSTQCAASGRAAHVVLLLYARRRPQGLLARRLRQHLHHRLQLLPPAAPLHSLHQMPVPACVVAVLTLIVILTLCAVVAVANDRRSPALVAAVVLVHGDQRVEFFGDLRLGTFFGADGHAIPGAGLPCVILALGGYAVGGEEVAAKLVDGAVAGAAVQPLLAVGRVDAHLEGDDVLEELDDVAASLDRLGVQAKGTAGLSIPAAFAFENLPISDLLKLYFAFPSAGGRAVLLVIRAPGVRLHQQRLRSLVGNVLAEPGVGAVCGLI